MEYKDFIERKKHTANEFGFKCNYIPKQAFNFQAEIIKKATKKGRVAIFADTGLGKTLIQLSIAQNIVNHTKGKVLILTPLAVSFQFLKEAQFLGIDSIEVTRDGKNLNSNIILCNYERLNYLDSNDFEGVILDESSILKNFNGKIKNHITIFMKKINYRFLSTATPAPNDYIEFGTSSEAIGYMGYMDMLGKFFANNENNIRAHDIGNKFYLKPHAEKDFFNWLNTWAINIQKPSDLGFSDERYKLPKLNEKTIIVKNEKKQVDGKQLLLFNNFYRKMPDVRNEQKETIEIRCNKAYEIAKTIPNEPLVYWVNFNDESKYLSKLDNESVEINGSMTIDKKESILLDFAQGKIKRLITKAKITSFGLNWQHCCNTIYFSTWSYEQYYQAIRRFYRFGQKRQVNVYNIISDGQIRVIEALNYKKEKANKFNKIIKSHLSKDFNNKIKEFDKEIIKPTFL